ncbi:MAG: hypothetical protein A2Z37_15880 [Chloroflexi bacterium RBG_19FT_COMBO_62_14]|nr:MAG: hypothetical protein A2Z37_15880 [Chloroflexi bacterium RBG_19FT_COMBO_62_14]
MLLAALLPGAIAEAHAELVKAAPGPGAVVSPGIREIRLTFNEPLVEGSSITLFAEGFQTVSGIQTQLQGAELFAPIPRPLDPGQYTVQWAAVSDDEHKVEGSYQFTVEAETARPDWPWLLLIAIVVIGGLAFRTRCR